MNETDGNTFYVDQDRQCDEDGKSVNDLDLSVNSWLMLQDGEEQAVSGPDCCKGFEFNDEAPPSTQEPPCDKCRCQKSNCHEEACACCAQEDEAIEDNYLFAWLKAGCSSIERGVLSLGGADAPIV